MLAALARVQPQARAWAGVERSVLAQPQAQAALAGVALSVPVQPQAWKLRPPGQTSPLSKELFQGHWPGEPSWGLLPSVPTRLLILMEQAIGMAGFQH